MNPFTYFRDILNVFNTYLLFFFSVDTPFAQVKLGEVGEWFSRRNRSPKAFAGACSRGNYTNIINLIFKSNIIS